MTLSLTNVIQGMILSNIQEIVVIGRTSWVILIIMYCNFKRYNMKNI